GCYERTLAYLIEKYAGAFPLWLAPEQVKIIPIADRHLDWAGEVQAKLEAAGIRCSIDDRAEKMGKKIREATLAKTPYMLTVGDQEVENKTVSVRSRKGDNLGAMDMDALLAKLLTEVATKAR
ncbi:MAG: threonine--tRNA ligase, partial [Oscillospiraceae bacterium]|nr:threonine--tRNA ligase [Oscillospiraceae bacterium]